MKSEKGEPRDIHRALKFFLLFELGSEAQHEPVKPIKQSGARTKARDLLPGYFASVYY